MPAERARSDFEAATALLAHLRRNPQDARRPIRDLADSFGLSEALVREVLANAPRPSRTESTVRRPNSIFKAAASTWTRTVALFDRLTTNAYGFIAATSFVWLVLLFVRSLTPSADRSGATVSIGVSVSQASIALLIVAVTVGFLQMACFYHRRQTRLALFGGACLWVVLMTSFVVAFIRDSDPPNDLHPALLFLLVGIGMGFISLLYAGVGSLVSILGGWVHLRLRKDAAERRSRHELLSAFFDIQSRLETAQPVAEVKPEFWLFHSIRNRPLAWAVGFALFGAASVMILSIATGISPQAQSQTQPGVAAIVFALGSLILTVISLAFFILLTYLANSFRKAMGVMLISTVGGSLPLLIPIGPFGPQYLFSPNNLIGLLAAMIGYTVIAAVASVAAYIQAENKKERGLAQNEPSALLSELIRLQWKLAEGITEVCVLVVDAAGSSKMKSEADPLVVEFSFRAYQGWISRICAHHGGRIHATAGDGAVLAFPTCDGAMAAAQAMRSDLERFNRDENRLPSPFRLRIGLHVGEVVADLDKVEFAEVIDVAAHVEGMAPIGGIAVTRRVAERLPGLPFEPSGEVDGQQVVVLPPGVPA